MTHYKIVSRWNPATVLYEGEADSLKDLVGMAVKSGANLSRAYLFCADLSGANLSGANLSGADFDGHKIKTCRVLTGLYTYVAIPFVTESDERRIIMGCYNRSLAEWESDFWNNPSEFPNDGSEKSRLRLFAYETAKKWLEEFAPVETVITDTPTPDTTRETPKEEGNGRRD